MHEVLFVGSAQHRRSRFASLITASTHTAVPGWRRLHLGPQLPLRVLLGRQVRVLWLPTPNY